MLDNAIQSLNETEKPILHSDYAEENTMSKFFQIVLYKGFFAETSA
jgi:hypothetical protein